MKPPLELLISVLCRGGIITEDGNRFVFSEDNHLCVICEKNGEEVLLSVPCDISALSRMADKIGRDELWLQACAQQLQNFR